MANFSNDSEPENWNYNPYAADYACEFYFFSNDSNNWNYNPFINTPERERQIYAGRLERCEHMARGSATLL
jgi:hypothetical protein